MGSFVLGNNVVNIDHSMVSKVGLGAVDPAKWYTDLYGYFPVYHCTYSFNFPDDDYGCQRKIFNKIFEDLISCGEFSPIFFDYDSNDYEDTGDDPTRYIVTSNDFDKPIMIDFSFGDITVITHCGREHIREFINKYLKKYNDDSDVENVKCNVIVNNNGMLHMNDFKVNVKGNLDFGLYNDGFEDTHKEIINSINNDENGLYLLYGEPGTGKTTYIRHIIKECKNTKFVYIPANVANQFSDPGFLPFLLDNRGCVFIIEDCEDLVTTVDGIRSNAISNLLNLTDGFLGDALSIKVICTFNIDYGKIDDALLRPGRCRARYEFGLLKKEKAVEAAKRLGLKEPENDVSLADMFNNGKSFADEKRKRIGFNN